MLSSISPLPASIYIESFELPRCAPRRLKADARRDSPTARKTVNELLTLKIKEIIMKPFALSAARRIFVSLFFVVGLSFFALLWKSDWSSQAIFARSLKASALFMSKPVVNVHVSGAEIPTMALLNDEFCYTARISNTGGTDPGFAPYIRLITPVGVSLTSATLLNVSNTGSGNEQSTFTFTPATPVPVGTLPIQDPLLPTGNIVQGTGQLWIIQPPIGSVVNGQSAIDIRICLKVTAPALVNQQLQITHQPVYLYGTGTIAPNNQSFVLGDPTPPDPLMPVVVKFRKVALNAPVNDTVNGPAFEVVPGVCPQGPIQNGTTFRLIADIATNVSLTNLVFNDIFPAVPVQNGGTFPGLQLTPGAPVQVIINNTPQTVTPGAPLGGPYGFSVNWPSATGMAGSSEDVIVEFRANVPQFFFGNLNSQYTCPTNEIVNQATFDAVYGVQPIQQQNSQVRLAAKLVSLTKTASPAVAAPGDTITYTLRVRISEAETLSLVHISDVFQNGLTYVNGSIVLTVNNINSPNFIQNVVPNGNNLDFDIKNGNSPVIGACDDVVITYQATVSQTYPSNQPVLAGDRLTNTASIGYTRFVTTPKVECYGALGDNAASQVVIRPANEVTKAIINNPQPAQFLPGDEVKFSLKMCIPSGDAKGIMFKDYLPADFFDLSTVGLLNFIKTPSTVNATLSPPLVSTQDGSVMFTINPDPFMTNPTTPTCFEVQFKVKVANKTFPSALTITNYLLAKTVKSDNSEDQHTAGVTLTIGQSNPVLTITKSICSVGTGAAGTVNSSGNVDNADAGDKLTYCITITNNSQATAHQVVFTDTVPTGLTYVNGSFTGATLVSQPPILQALLQQLSPGQTITLGYMATVNNTAAPCTKITNEAEVKWASSSTGQATSSAKETAEVNFAKPTIMKTVKGQPTNPKATIGEEITYEIKVCLPEGTVPAFTIQDVVPSNLTCFPATVSGLINGTLACSGSGTVTWNIPSLTVPADNDSSNNCIIIELKVRVSDIPANMGMPGNQTTITNTASVAVPGCVTQSASVGVMVVEPKLTIDKVITPAVALPGQPVQIKLTITNNGTSSAFDVKVQDFLPPNLINPVHVSSPSDFVFSSSTGQVTYQGGEVKSDVTNNNNVVMLVFNAQAHVPCRKDNNLAAITAASTLLGDKTGERNYASLNITDTAEYEIKCECVKPPYLNTKGMTAWWPFDEVSGTIAADIANVANNGTKSANTSSIPSELVGRSLNFNGNSSFVQVPGNQADLQFGTGNFSIDVWVKPSVALGIRPIVDKTGVVLVGNTLTLSGYTLFLDNGRLRARVGTTVYSPNITDPNLADNNWHHVALSVRRPSNPQLVLYVDGNTIGLTSSVTTANVTNIADLTIGRGNLIVTLFKDYFSGRIDEVELFRVALTAAEVQSIYKAGSAGKCKPLCTLVCQPTTLPAGTAGMPYGPVPVVGGGTPGYSYSATNLPPGLSLTTNGNLTGTPMTSGFYSFSITVTDQTGCSKTCPYNLTVNCLAPAITTASPLPNGTLGAAYNQTLAASGGGTACGAYQFTQVGGTLPPGVLLSSSGTLGTKPLIPVSACGTFDFTVKVTDKCGCMATKAFSITIEGSMIMPINDAFNTGVNDDKTVRSIGQPELSGHYVLTANGNPVTASVIPKQSSWVSPTNNPNPAAWIGPSPAQASNQMIYTLMLDLTHCYSSTVQIAGQYAASGSGYIRVNGGATQYSPTPTNGAATFTPIVLPSSSFISGVKNIIQFYVTAIPGVPPGLLVEFSMAIKKCCPCQLTVGPNTLPDGKAGTPYNGQFTATGGTPPYTYQVTVTPPVPGIVFGSNGQISGTPLMCGDYTIFVKATDSQGCMGIRQYTLKIKCSLTDIAYETNGMPGSGLVAQEPTPSQLIAYINYQALGNEKAVRFSLGFDPALLSNPLVTLGSGFQNATLDLDVSQLDQGNLGISVAVPDGETFAEGRSELVTVVWEYAGTEQGRATRIEFKDSPVARSVIDQSGAAVQTQFKPSPIVLATKAAIVSAASYGGERLAPEEIVAAFGVGMATATQVATTIPLPTSLAGTTIKVRDSANVERLAPLFFVAPTQINYLIPAGTAAGTATVIITSGNGTVSGAVVEIANVAPGIFVADASGRGLPAANALTFKPDGSSSSSPVARFDPASSRFVAVPIDLGAIGDRVFLSLFGTGVRRRSSLEAVRAIIGGVEAPLQFVGDQGGFAGLDQINIELPRSLAGSGLVDVLLIVDGQIANVVQVNIR